MRTTHSKLDDLDAELFRVRADLNLVAGPHVLELAKENLLTNTRLTKIRERKGVTTVKHRCHTYTIDPELTGYLITVDGTQRYLDEAFEPVQRLTPQEIRVGNWYAVYDNKEKRHTEQQMSDPSEYSIFLNAIPLPITGDRLRDLRFNQLGGDDEEFIEMLPIYCKDEITVAFYDDDTLESVSLDMRPIPAKYIHELQMLYRGIYGKELSTEY